MYLHTNSNDKASKYYLSLFLYFCISYSYEMISYKCNHVNDNHINVKWNFDIIRYKNSRKLSLY